MNLRDPSSAGHETRLSLMSTRREYLTFVVAEELYAVPLASIVEIVAGKKLTPVPRGPSDVLGICSVRGELMSVLDVRRRLRRGTSQPQRGRILLAFSPVGEKLGLWVDEVRGVHRLTPGEIEPTIGTFSSEIGTLSEGIARLGSQLVVLLNLAGLTA